MMESASAARRKLEALAAARSPRGLFLTVTLSTSPVENWRQFAPTFLNSEFNRIEKESALTKDEKHRLDSDFREVFDIIGHDIGVSGGTQGLALFADGGPGVFERIELPLPLLNRVVLEPSPHIRPVIHALSLMEPFVVAKVSRDESSLFVVDEWGVAREDDLAGPWLRTSDRETGELSIKEYFAAKRMETLVDQHFKEVGATLAKLLEATGTRRVVLSALHEIATNFRAHLPQATAAHIVAEIPFDPTMTPAQLLAPARKAIQEARRRELADLAARIKDNVSSGGRGAAGFDDCLGALGRGQVQTLLVDRNLRVPGWRCAECGWVALRPEESCPDCGARVAPLEDGVSELMRLAVLQSARIEIGEDLPVLNEMGGVAGLLRYV